MEARVDSGGPFQLDWVLKTKEDWAAYKKTIEEEHRDTAARLLEHHPKDCTPQQQCGYARLLLGWLTFEGPLPVPKKTPRQHRRAKDKLKQQRRQLEGSSKARNEFETHTFPLDCALSKHPH